MKNRIGEKYTTIEGYTIEIVEYIHAKNCSVKFENGYIAKELIYGNIKKGAVKNPLHKSKYNVGYFGIGKYTARINGKKSKSYQLWSGIMTRCYNPNFHALQPTYINCKVEESWLNYQIFAEWFYNNYDPSIMKDWCLDKDILSKGNKIYGSYTCGFVPHEINNIFTKRESLRGIYPIGVRKHGKRFVSEMTQKGISKYIGIFDTAIEAFHAYKTEKENIIKNTANKYKGLISEDIYNAMINYDVKITD